MADPALMLAQGDHMFAANLDDNCEDEETPNSNNNNRNINVNNNFSERSNKEVLSSEEKKLEDKLSILTKRKPNKKAEAPEEAAIPKAPSPTPSQIPTSSSSSKATPKINKDFADLPLTLQPRSSNRRATTHSNNPANKATTFTLNVMIFVVVVLLLALLLKKWAILAH